MRVLRLPALFALLGAISLLAGDLTITSQVTGKGAFAKDGTQVQLFSPTRMRINHSTSQTDSMVDYGKGVIYAIDHKKKSITHMSFQDMQEAMEAMEQQMAGMPEFVTKMMFGDVSDIKVEPLGEEKILGRTCRKVRIHLGKMVQEISADPSLQFPIKDYAKAMTMLNRTPGQMGVLFRRVYEETARLKGVPLKTHISGLMGMDVTTVATAISAAPIAASAWALPDGYAQRDGGKELKEAMKKGR